MTGQLTSPPTTLGSTPSIPAATTMALARRTSRGDGGVGGCRPRRRQPVRDLTANGPRGDNSFLRHRQVAGSRSDDDYLPSNSGSSAGGEPKSSGEAVLLPLRELTSQVFCLFRIDSSCQAILTGLDQLAYHAFNPLAGFPFAEQDLRKSASFATVQVDVT